jgi:hypothetical protein
LTSVHDARVRIAHSSDENEKDEDDIAGADVRLIGRPIDRLNGLIVRE